MNITRDDIVRRVDGAGAFLLANRPSPPVSADDIVAAAETFDLPVRATNVANDPVARAVFVAAYCSEATKTLELAYDAVWSLFRIPPRPAAC